MFVKVIRMEIKSDYLSRFVSELREEFREEAGWETEVDERVGYIRVFYSDRYCSVKMIIVLNEYSVPVLLSVTKADKDEEIIMPESCHTCSEFCIYYDSVNETCKRGYEEVSREFSEWERVLCETKNIRIERVVYEEGCYLDIPHCHYYRAYKIEYRGPITIDTIKAFNELFDDIIALVEK